MTQTYEYQVHTIAPATAWGREDGRWMLHCVNKVMDVVRLLCQCGSEVRAGFRPSIWAWPCDLYTLDQKPNMTKDTVKSLIFSYKLLMSV